MAADAGQPAVQLGAPGLAEVVALVVAVAAADGPAFGVEQQQRVLLMGLQSHAGGAVEPEHGTYDVFEVAQEPLGGDGAAGASCAAGEAGDRLGEAGAHELAVPLSVGRGRGLGDTKPAMQAASSPGANGLFRIITSRPGTGSPSGPLTASQAGSRTMSNPGWAACHCSKSPVRRSRWTSTPR